MNERTRLEELVELAKESRKYNRLSSTENKVQGMPELEKVLKQIAARKKVAQYDISKPYDL